ncbi:type 4a pilus biogenesis protein PilO [Vibrio palustris]|uniref:MSHA biogenesis protein MshJ n=1 Tax=Vibrio palustris TaxID=1918946 RepID=A0A1R4B7I4_9VIBR|nr:type 4a pilus biogenesis protein PilO [Vibrio palustris]SJL84887.1 hypothetical protein VPAL9027_02890 [Vibrio palustris]
MNERWSQLSSWFNGRLPREKILIAIGAVTGVFFILQALLLDKIDSALTLTRQQLQEADLNNIRTQNDITVLKKKLAVDPDTKINQELEQVEKKYSTLKAQLAEKRKAMVSPTQMTSLLQRVLKSKQELTLISMESLPSERLGSKTDMDVEHYYLHPIRMEFTGDYFSVLDYLHAIESLPVKYYWRRFDYNVASYPRGRVAVEVYTIGTKEEFIGG